MQKGREKILVFGASGAIGGAIAKYFVDQEWDVVGVARKSEDIRHGIPLGLDPLVADADLSQLVMHRPYSAVCWAQGSNLGDSVFDVDLEQHIDVYKSNCLYILATLKYLLQTESLIAGARLCIISSIWQNLARQDKLSYCMSKAALQGLVLSASVDLGRQGILINAVLPGALDTLMTRRNLATDQIERLSNATFFKRMPKLEDVTSAVGFLCSPANTGTTGQFIEVDLGFSHARLL